jgi:hypothetical protein
MKHLLHIFKHPREKIKSLQIFCCVESLRRIYILYILFVSKTFPGLNLFLKNCFSCSHTHIFLEHDKTDQLTIIINDSFFHFNFSK